MKYNTIILDPIVQQFVDALAAQNGTPIYKLPVDQARKVLDDAQALPITKLDVDIQHHTITTTAWGSFTVSLYRPQGNTQKLPLIVFIHGAGWVLGNQGTHDRLVREITNGSGAAVLFVEYDRAPEKQFPTAHEQGYAAAQWAHENSALLNIDNARMAIVGDSVGGLMATAIALMAQERGGPQFIFQALLYPTINADFTTPSYEQFAQGPWLTKPAMQWFWDKYVPNIKDRTNHYASPIHASLEQLSKLPPTLLLTNEYDVLRDEAEAYAHKLMRAGVPTVSMRLLGMIHDSMMLNAITQAPAIRTAIDLTNRMLKNVLNR